MTLRRKRIVLMPNTEKNIDPQWMNSLVFHLHEIGCDLRAPESSRRMFSQAEACIAFFEDKDPLYEKADLILVFGGDGSIIRAARSSVGREIPIAGINCGRLGYLAEIESNETDLLDAIVTGEGIIERRIMLDVQILREDTILGVDTPALNDIVLTNGPLPKLLSFGLYCNGELVENCYADGMILAAPTGSTAYSMSAGGPILDPCLNCICATPICPQTMNNRPVIFSGDSTLEFRNISSRGNTAFLSIDGQESIMLHPTDTVRIFRSPYHTNLIRIKQGGFLSALRRKLS
ncbi:MAG: NAD(+)/NADH kinase [Clostridia bacterium]|nr:NAD(+)/NADH kinase [Clostridia bacterium]